MPRDRPWCVLLVLCGSAAAQAAISTLWGTNGAEWVQNGGASSQLSDFSFAGYDFGNSAPPLRANTKFASDYNVSADGVHDDSAALQAALDELMPGDALLIEAGTYRLDTPIFLRTSNVTVRGEGIDKTVLKPSRSLFDVYGMGSCVAGTNKGYGWCRGFFELESTVASYTVLATVSGSASTRGSSILTVDSVDNIAVGDDVYLRMTDDGQQAMYKYFLGDDATSVPADSRTLTMDSFAARIVMLNGNAVTLNRPLPFDVRPEWTPTLRPAGKTVEFVGLEDLSFIFPDSPPYPGHHQGSGYNAVEFSQSYNSWIRRLKIMNADLAINLRASYQCEVSETVFIQTRQESSLLCGHHGIDLSRSSSNLLKNLYFIGSKFVHDITVDLSFVNVITSSYFTALSADHHGNSPMANLWDNIITDSFDRLWVSGGSGGALPHSGQLETFWNVRSISPNASAHYVPSVPIGAPNALYHGLIITPYASSAGVGHSSHFLEKITSIHPESIYYAQVERRLTAPPPVPLPLPGQEGAPCRLQPSPNRDPTCSTGIQTNEACCPSTCGLCGGSGCASAPGGAVQCCYGDVSSMAPPCDYFPPPCVVSATPLPPLPPPCEASNLACDCNGICVSNATGLPPCGESDRSTTTDFQTTRSTTKSVHQASVAPQQSVVGAAFVVIVFTVFVLNLYN